MGEVFFQWVVVDELGCYVDVWQVELVYCDVGDLFFVEFEYDGNWFEWMLFLFYVFFEDGLVVFGQVEDFYQCVEGFLQVFGVFVGDGQVEVWLVVGDDYVVVVEDDFVGWWDWLYMDLVVF